MLPDRTKIPLESFDIFRLIDVTQDYTGEFIMVSGQFRSYNRHEEQKNRLVLSVFVREVEFIEEELDGAKTNHILLPKTSWLYVNLDATSPMIVTWLFSIILSDINFLPSPIVFLHPYNL